MSARVEDPVRYGIDDKTWPDGVACDDARCVYVYFESLPLIVVAGLR